MSLKQRSIKRKLMLILACTMAMGQGAMAADNKSTDARITPCPGVYGYYVDVYQNNTKQNMTVETNPAIGVLSGFLELWTPGTTWNDGKQLQPNVLQQNIKHCEEITKQRTKEEGEKAYLDDRRHQSYSIISGLGVYQENFKKESLAGTTIVDQIPLDANKVLYTDEGNKDKNWADETKGYGSIVKLVNTVRGDAATTSPAKAYFKYPRPFRWSDKVQILETLVPAKKADPTNDGGFPSGHTNAAYLAAFGFAYAIPEQYNDLLLRASELGNDRIVAGMHSCFDVMGGRVMATAVAAAILNDSANQTLKQTAYDEARMLVKSVKNSETLEMDRTQYQKKLKVYTDRLTYGFAQTGDQTKPMVVPKGAEVLLETRLPYLDATQRRWVLYTTALPSGYPVLDDKEGWGRLNLMAAANGYGAFETDVVVNMDASKGGFYEKDIWLNDIKGQGKLTKAGTGTLSLKGENSYTGGTVIQAGTLDACSQTALGKGDVTEQGGTLEEHVKGTVTIAGDFTQNKEGVLTLNIEEAQDLLEIEGKAKLAGKLIVNLSKDMQIAQSMTLIRFKDRPQQTTFSEVVINGLKSGQKAKIVYENQAVVLKLQ